MLQNTTMATLTLLDYAATIGASIPAGKAYYVVTP